MPSVRTLVFSSSVKRMHRVRFDLRESTGSTRNGISARPDVTSSWFLVALDISRNRIFGSFFETETCHEISRRSLAGGRLLAFGVLERSRIIRSGVQFC